MSESATTVKPALPYGVRRDGADAAKRGSRYWVIGLNDGREMSLHAEEVTVSETGVIAAVNSEGGLDLVLPAGQWTHCYAASVWD